jgi:hypothetical protein
MTERFDLTGVVATAWSRWGVDTLQCVPIDAALDTMVAVGVILHDGKMPEGGIDACVNALEELGEKKRFEDCKKAMERLTNIRRSGWVNVQRAREKIVLCKIDPRRTSARNPIQGFKAPGYLHGTARRADRIAHQIRQTFKGLVPDIFIEEYIATRLTPLKEEWESVKIEIEKLEEKR